MNQPESGDRAQRILFRNGLGYELVGLLTLPPAGRQPAAALVFSHGFDSGKDSPRGLVLAAALERAGLATFRIDFTGHGESQGAKEESTIARQTDDLVCALDALGAHEAPLDPDRLGVCGASSGAVVALRAAGRDYRIRLLALRSPSPRPDLPELARTVTVPTLVVESDEPRLLESSRALCDNLGGPHRLEVVPGAGHLFEGRGSLERMIELTVGWCLEWLG